MRLLTVLTALFISLPSFARYYVTVPSRCGDSFTIDAHGHGGSCSDAIAERIMLYGMAEQIVVDKCRALGGWAVFTGPSFPFGIRGCHSYVATGILFSSTRYMSSVHNEGYCSCPASSTPSPIPPTYVFPTPTPSPTPYL